MNKKYQGFIAMIVAMAMIFTYSIAPIREGVGAALDVVLGPLAGMRRGLFIGFINGVGIAAQRWESWPCYL